MYHYVYRLEDIKTGEFYIGSRSCQNHPTLDNYLGSMVVWKPNKKMLKKEILKSDFKNREDANEYEKFLIESNINDDLNRNFSIPPKTFFVDKNTFKDRNHQKGENNSQYGTCWITNGIEVKKIKKSELLPNDWFYGRTLKIKKKNNGNGQKGKYNSQYDTKWITNGVENRKIKKSDTIPDGWKYGCINKKMCGYKWITNGVENKKLKKGENKPDGWKYGLTEDIGIKISNKLKGRKLSDKVKKKMSISQFKRWSKNISCGRAEASSLGS